MKQPAKVPVTDPKYGGGILVNPGGPGGSGITLIQLYGNFIQRVVDTDDKKYFDLIGFDPRGVGRTCPVATCFNKQADRSLFFDLNLQYGLLEEAERVIDFKWANFHALGGQCAAQGIGADTTTATVATDMLHIVDKMEEALQGELAPSSKSLKRVDPEPKAKLQYIGFSYGTYLGNTFASMYPDRVGRLVLDGIVDAPDYASQAWKKIVLDADKILPRVYKYCFEAGPKKCPLYNAKGPKAIAKEVDAILENLKHNPAPAFDTASSPTLPPNVITYSLMKNILFTSAYFPADDLPSAFAILASVRDRQYNSILSVANSFTAIDCDDPKGIDDDASAGGESQAATVCGDGAPKSNETKASFKRYHDVLRNQSSIGGSIIAEIRLSCTGWLTRPRFRFTGPFGGLPANPILWLSGEVDPVTPLQNAFSMAKLFEGSSVIHSDGEGHTLLLNLPSKCAIDAVRKYFDTAEVPKGDKFCPVKRHAFQTRKDAMDNFNGLYDERYGGWLPAPRWKAGRGQQLRL